NTRVSVAADGSYCSNPSVGFSVSPAISDDGRYVAFVSNCTNFVPGDGNGTYDVFVRDTCRANGALVPSCGPTTERLSGLTGAPDQFGDVDTGSIDMSADGRFVVWASRYGFAAKQQVLVRDRILGTIEVASVDS